jgi:hypothetical protein
VAEARLHMPQPRRRVPPLRLHVPSPLRHVPQLRLPNRVPPPPLPAWRHLALRRRIARGPDLGWLCLALLRPVSRPLLHGSRLSELTWLRRMLPPKSQPLTSPLRAAGRRTPLLAGAGRTVCPRPQNRMRLRLCPTFLARRESESTPLRLHLRREDAFEATNRPKGKPLANRSPARVEWARSGKLQLPRVATEIEMQIGR